jgi:hypothetical protein
MINIPEKIPIAGKWCKVKVDKKTADSSFDNQKHEIIIGTKVKEDKLENFLHESLEAVIAENLHRYDIYGGETNEKLLFSFNHADFVLIVQDFTLVIDTLLKKNKKQRRV